MKKIYLKGEEVKREGSFLMKGDLSPDFCLVTADLKNTRLEDYKGKRKVLAIVPSIDTPVCQMETKRINDLAKEFPEVVFLTISKDLPFAQKRFCMQEKLANVDLLSDMRPHSYFGKNFGLLLASGPLEGLLARAIIVLNEHDRVEYSELVSEITEAPNFEILKEVLQKSAS